MCCFIADMSHLAYYWCRYSTRISRKNENLAFPLEQAERFGNIRGR